MSEFRFGEVYYSLEDEYHIKEGSPFKVEGSSFYTNKCYTILCIVGVKKEYVVYTQFKVNDLRDTEGKFNCVISRRKKVTLNAFEEYLKRYTFVKIPMANSYTDDDYMGSDYKILKVDNPMLQDQNTIYVREVSGIECKNRNNDFYTPYTGYNKIANASDNYHSENRKSVIVSIITPNRITEYSLRASGARAFMGSNRFFNPYDGIQASMWFEFIWEGDKLSEVFPTAKYLSVDRDNSSYIDPYTSKLGNIKLYTPGIMVYNDAYFDVEKFLN